ncbi:MAG TPA: hypothetical protein VFQ21_14085 [Gemmatimonadota bacterium]|nr:hypothetical protein [Gemmatimonadota bacterium]
MIAFDVFLIAGAVVLLCLAHWRAGVLAILVMGFALDPMRKLVPGEPLFFSVLVFVVVAATMIGMRVRGVRLSLKPILTWNPTLRVPLLLFVLLVVFQSLAAFLRTGSAPIAVIGLVAYLAPIPGVLIGYSYARSTADVKRVVMWYVVGVAIMTTGIYLSRSGYEWKVLKAVGVGLVAFTPTGERLTLASGFFRTPEIAAWHVAMATCFVIMLFLSRRRIAAYILPTIVGMLYFVVALLLTGRRKGLVEVAVFVLAYLTLIAFFRRRSIRTAVVLAAATVASIGIVLVTEIGATLDLSGYYERGTNIGATEAERYQRMSVGALKYVIQRNGWLGAGAGTGSQGAQYFGGGSRLVGMASEGGLGKVLAELGVPGLVLLFWLGIAISLRLWKVARSASRGGQRRVHYAYGMGAFLFANAVMFAVAHQVFGDPLVLYVIGLALGVAFAVPDMREGSRPQVPKEQPLHATIHAGPPR